MQHKPPGRTFFVVHSFYCISWASALTLCYYGGMTLLFFVAVFLAEIVGTLAGFGSSTVLLPLAVLLFDFRPALVLVAVVHIFGNMGRIMYFRHGLDRRTLLLFGLVSVLCTLPGALLVTKIDQTTLKGLLGLFLIGYTLLALTNHLHRLKSRAMTMILGGASSGFVAGLIGTGGALRGAFLNALHLPKETYIATAGAIALAVDLTRLPMYLKEGFLPEQYYWYVPPLFVIALVGSYVGKKIVNTLPQAAFRRIVLVAIGLIGIAFVTEWLTK